MREMKDSGIEWIGDIPDTWTIKRMLYCLDSVVDYRGKTPEKVDEGILLVTAKNIKDGKIDYEISREYVREELYDEIMHRGKLKIGDVLFTTEAPLGEVANVDSTDFALAQRVIKFRADDTKLDNYYLKYCLMAPNTQQFLQMLSSGSTAAGIKASKLPLIKIPLPDIDIQRKIVSFLNDVCLNIDKTASDIQHQIELLQEYKQSVITEAVTKGLDKNVAMKDSRIEWIGDIPHTWNVYRLKYIVKSSLQYGANESGLEYTDELPRYVRITDIDNNGRLKDTDKQSLDLHTAKPYLLDSNDILLARSGATVGKAFLYHESDGPCAFAGYLIRAKCKTELLSKLVYYYTMSYSYNDWKNSIFSQATIPNIGADKYSNLRIPISPNEKEQRKIIDYLDQKCAEIDAVLTDKQKQLDTLTEYKKSLIYEYVTGKKEVPADA